MSKHWIFDVFEFRKEISGNVTAQCKLCPKKINGHTKSRSNFITHIKRVHYETYTKKTEDEKTNVKPPPSVSDCPTTLVVAKYAPSHPKQQHITNALVKFVAGGLLPLSTVDNQEFPELCKSMDPKYQVPDRKTFSTKLLHEKSSEVRSNLKHQLKLSESVALTLDLWSNRQTRGFLGITGHFIMNWSLKTVMIACKRVKGSHTSQKIREEYEDCIASYDLANKISCIITDNASNMQKAFDFDLPGFGNEHVTIDTDTDFEDDEMVDVDETISDDIDILPEFDDVIVPKHRNCFAHTLQLVIKDGFKGMNQNLQNVIAKASKIVSFVRKSVVASDLLEGEKRLQTANQTRWNSQLIMIRSVLSIDEEKLNKACPTVTLTSYERKLLTQVTEILKPFEEATDQVQRDKSVSASLSVPTIVCLQRKLNHVAEIYKGNFTKELKSSLERRFSTYMEDDMFRIAAILDPRFRMTWASASEVSSLTDILVTEGLRFQEIDEVLSPPSKDLKLEEDSLFSFLTPTKRRHRSGADPISLEVKAYLNEDNEHLSVNPLDYWKNSESDYPILAKMAKHYLAIPASSAPVERLFSVAGKIFRPDRCSLTDRRFHELMMLKCNAKI